MAKAAARNSEADAGSMKGYDPNLGLKRSQVATSRYTPKSGPMAPRKPMQPKMRATKSPMPGLALNRKGAQGNAMTTTMMTPGMKAGQSAFNRMIKR